MSVPFVDLRQQYHSIKAEIDAALLEVLESSSYILGRYVERFEDQVCRFLDTRYAIGVNSGTDALLLSLVAAGIGPGDEVITVANSFFATAEAISLSGAKPVFVDVQEHTFNMDSSLLEAAVTSRTRAIVPVHLYGQPCDMDEIMAVAERFGLIVIEDACQAMGAKYKGRRAGSIGLAGCFSFVPAKNLGSFGDGGMVVTSDELLAAKIRLLRDHGSARKYEHERVGYNSRLDSLQAAVLSVKLGYLDDWNAARGRWAAEYDGLLSDVDVVRPSTSPGRSHIYHLYVVRARDRASVQAELGGKGVSTLIHYPIPLHRQAAYRDANYPELPVTEKLAREILSLPMWPMMSSEQVRETAEALQRAVGSAGASKAAGGRLG
ncbi:MAG: DegT/DnrJ/EryC1/StrS family aminotransferase [Syntrophobacteraceae bacterium]|nr:DegT/DnrJ/EryC1/StrS family aminotransferase [Desulfobacteraceae bacterium]